MVLIVYNQRERVVNTQKESATSAVAVEAKPIHFQYLASIKHHESFYAKDLQDTLVYLGKNSRPDARADQIQYLIGLKGTHQTAIAQPAQKLYLFYGAQGLEFSEEPKSLWIKFKEAQSDALEYDAAMFLAEEDQEVYQEKIQGITYLTQAESFDDQITQQSCFQKFEHVRWWKPDLFYEAYGGAEFAEIKGSHRLEFDSLSEHERGRLCYVKPKTQLIFKEEQWEVKQGDMDSHLYPMAEILSITPLHMEVKIWDVSGIYPKQLSLSAQRIKPLSIKIEELFTHIRPRPARQISCKIEGKTVLLREGDWLLHLGERWKLIRSAEEIQRYLSLQLEGEMFVCEGIEKNQGNTVFKGQLFDTMREQTQTVRIPIAAVKSKRSTSKDRAKRHDEKQSPTQQAATISQVNRESAPANAEDELLRLATPQKRNEFSK